MIKSKQINSFFQEKSLWWRWKKYICVN